MNVMCHFPLSCDVGRGIKKEKKEVKCRESVENGVVLIFSILFDWLIVRANIQKQQQELEKEMEALHMGSDGSPKLDSTSPSKKGKG